ncbi:MAG: bis(5'-nucleosidyl)-tetraphosphatase [Patiriisocius sp.]|jgi:bis(5'-nucleosidyl)-tetraphosphatase
MQTIRDYSYGVIPVIKTGDTWEVFILKQISYRGSDDRYWTFPKGHPEDGESQEETALRELKEESAITLDSLAPEVMFDQKYSFTHKEQHIEKSVCYYLGYAIDKTFQIQVEEVEEGRWCSFAEAREMLTHSIAKELLDGVTVYLKNKDLNMKTIKCYDCEADLHSETRAEILDALYEHYMKDHNDVIIGASGEAKKEWMVQFEKDWAAAENVA